MAFREVSVVQIREVLRRWLKGESERRIAQGAGVDRKTVRRYIQGAIDLGLDRNGGEEQLTGELFGQIVERVRPQRPDGHGEAWRELIARQDQITKWVDDGLTVVKIGTLLCRSGTQVPQRTLARFAVERCGAGKRRTTVRVEASFKSISVVSVSCPTTSIVACAGLSSSRRVTAAISSCGRRSARPPRR
jgi:DNA-binding CsgD family transcriptional regulator